MRTAVVSVLVLGLLQPASQRSTREGLALLRSLQDALGGTATVAAVRDVEEIIVADAWDAAGTPLGKVRKRTRWMRAPGLLRLDQIGPRGTYVLYYDSSAGHGWEIPPDLRSADAYKTTGTPIDLVGGELEFAKGYLGGFELNLWLADRHPTWVVTSPRLNVLRIAHDGNANDFSLDPATKLPMSSTGVSLADPDRPVAAEMRFSAWKDVSGMRWPTQRTNYHSGVKRGEVITEMIRTNVGLRQEDLAQKPADFAPDIPRR